MEENTQRVLLLNRICLTTALLYLAIVVPLRQHLAPATAGDFNQYYMGGVVAREGQWADLYPIPKPGAGVNPGHPRGSDLRPGYAQLAAENGVSGDLWRFIQPPPVALLMMPLAWFDFSTSLIIFRILSTICVAVVAIIAGRITARLAGKPSWVSGTVTLLVATSPMTLVSIRTANVSPMVGAAVAITLYGCMHRSTSASMAAGTASVLGMLLKYATVPLLPVVLAAERWKIVTMTAWIGGLVLLLTLPATGVERYWQFLVKIAPHFDELEIFEANQSLRSFLVRLFRDASPPLWFALAFALLRWSVLALLLALVYWSRKAIRIRETALIAGGMAMMAWFLIFSPVAHSHYFIYFCFGWGWALMVTRGRPLARMLAIAAIGLTWCPLAGGRWSPLPLYISAHMLYGSLIFLTLAVLTLLREQRAMATTSETFKMPVVIPA